LTLNRYYDKVWKGGIHMAVKKTTKKPLFGNKRSHALNITKRKQKPNLQKKTINGKKVRISTRETKKTK